MELATDRLYQVGSLDLGHDQYQFAHQEAFEVGEQERHQYLGPIREFQQILRADPQTPSSLPLFHTISHHEQNPNEMQQAKQPNRSVYDGMHVQNIRESTNGLDHRQRHHELPPHLRPRKTPRVNNVSFP
jgi:hypothetical protein